MSFKSLTSRLDAFRKDERGYVTIEVMIVLPALLWIFGAGWTLFDAYRHQAVSHKANYTIGDMISRETDPLDADYIANARRLLTTLTDSPHAEVGLRISAVRFDGDAGEWLLEWSQRRGGMAPAKMNQAELNGMTDRLPVSVGGDQLVIVETWDQWEPAFDIGLGSFAVQTYSFTRPRYAPQVVFDNGGAAGAGA